MLHLALRGVRYNSARYIATLLAILTGVAFFSATGFVSDRVIDSLEGDVDRQYGNVDVAVVVDDDRAVRRQVRRDPHHPRRPTPRSSSSVPGVDAGGGVAHRSGRVPRRRPEDLRRRHHRSAVDRRRRVEPAAARSRAAPRAPRADRRRPGHGQEARSRRRRHGRPCSACRASTRRRSSASPSSATATRSTSNGTVSIYRGRRVRLVAQRHARSTTATTSAGPVIRRSWPRRSKPLVPSGFEAADRRRVPMPTSATRSAPSAGS